MSPLYPAGQTPYLGLSEMLSAPTGIDWTTIPSGSQVTPQQRTAEQLNILGRATARVDRVCNQPLRATLDYENVYGPHFRATVETGNGNGRIILSRWPVLSVIAVRVAPANVFPRQWTQVPQGNWDLAVPPISVFGTIAPAAAADGGQAILLPPGWLNWANGRNGWLIQVQYINGWPHTSLTADAAEGAMAVQVDDCTGWAVTSEWGQAGAAGTVYDTGYQETVQAAAASVPAGPGTLTLGSPLLYAHTAGTMVTTLPQSVIDATIVFSAAQALQRGATSTTVQVIPGGSGGGGALGTITEYIKQGEALLCAFKRTI